jgi:hypothetical protein
LEYRYCIWGTIIFTTITASALGIVPPIAFYSLWEAISWTFFISLEMATCLQPGPYATVTDTANFLIKHCLVLYQGIIFANGLGG